MSFSRPNVFAEAKLGKYPKRKGTPCVLSGVLIESGDSAYAVKFKHSSESPSYWISEAAARQCPQFLENVRNLERYTYPAHLLFYRNEDNTKLLDWTWGQIENQRKKRSDMRHALNYEGREDPSGITRQLDMSYDAMREELAKPEPCYPEPLSDDGVWEKIVSNIQALHGNPVELAGPRVWKFLGLVTMCDLHTRLAAHFSELQPELQLLLACSDNHVFGKLADRSGLLPGWLTIHSLIAQPRLRLEDMLQLAEWGRNHPDALTLIWKTHVRFGLLSFDIGNDLGFATMMANGHSAHLLYLFTARPDLCPMLTVFAPDADYAAQEAALQQEFYGFVPSLAYQLPYLYRAKVFEALLSGNAEKARQLISMMRQRCGYYYHGSPAGFINDTGKMVEQYIKNWLCSCSQADG